MSERRITDWAQKVADEHDVPILKIIGTFNILYKFHDADKCKNMIETALIEGVVEK